MTPAQLKEEILSRNPDNHFFTRKTMQFFGDTMRNYGVRGAVIGDRQVWELYRKRPVKHGFQVSTFFDKETFKRAWRS